MTFSTDLAVTVGSVAMETPLIVASGLWPFDGPFWCEEALGGIGAVSSKGLTLHPRPGNGGVRVWETPSGLLNSIGLQNPGVEAFAGEIIPGLPRRRPLIANVAVERLDDLERSLDLLQAMNLPPEVVELNVSCPNVDGGGMAWGLDASGVRQVLDVARPVWRGPLWLKLTPQAPRLDEITAAAESGGADALVVANTWLGMAIDVDRRSPVFDRTFAGLSGPAVFPLSLRLLWETASLTALPLIGCGGVSSGRDVLAMIMAGASAVEVGTALVREFHAPLRFCREISAYLEERGLRSVASLSGCAREGRKERR